MTYEGSWEAALDAVIDEMGYGGPGINQFGGYATEPLLDFVQSCMAKLRDFDFSELDQADESVDSLLKGLWGAMLRMGLAGYVGYNACTFDFRTALAEIGDICTSKQNDYGHENIAGFGMVGLIVRVNDKVARITNLLTSGREVANESIQDTWVDIVGYSLIARMWLDDTFLLPMAKDLVAPSRMTTRVTVGSNPQNFLTPTQPSGTV